MIGGWNKSNLEGKKSLLAVLITFAIASLGATIVFPIFAPLFLSPDQSIFQNDLPGHLRAVFLGLFLAAFPIGQFLFSPLIGEFADRKGRKIAYLLTLGLEVVGYACSAYAITSLSLTLLFLGRFLTGLAAGNMSVCLATLVDLSKDEKTKMRYFSYGSAVAGVMFVLGPFIGGKLADKDLASWFNLATPMWVGAGLAVINFFVMLFLFHETLKDHADRSFDPMKAIHNVQQAFKTKTVRDLYLVYFFFLFAWNMLYQFLPAVVVQKFSTKTSIIGDVSAFMGVIWIVGTLLMGRLLHAHTHLKFYLFAFLLIFAIATLSMPYPTSLLYLILTTGVAVLFAGGMWPFFTTAISNAADQKMQGKILGLSQSIQSLSMLLAPLLGGFFLEAHTQVPFAIAALSALIASALLLKTKSRYFQI